ncbi:MAG TPA: hypothetical protein VFL91_10020 [Thermomicrobiales bacterium]|nr:hypothetical protein [Thermomicrobiales bacterium]
MAHPHDELDADRRWIAAAFRELRLARGLTQERAAEAADLQKAATISEFENNASRIPPPWTRRRLYAAYGVAQARRAEVEARIARYRERERRARLLTLRGDAPPVVGPLIGRAAEVAETLRLLRQGDTHPVTLTGVGGVGKTRLAIEVARAYAAEVGRPAVFVDLSEVRHRDGSDPRAELEREIARALDVAATAEHRLGERVVAALRRVGLLVVDNVEHTLPSLGYLAPLRPAAPGLRILLTSRVRPELADQRVVPVEPLAVPAEEGSPTDPGDPAAGPAVALLFDRMRRLRPDFRPAGGDTATLAAICRNLDGLPLALELAAPHCVDLPLAVAAARLRRRLAVLRDAGGTRPARQRSLQATLDWSCDLLADADRRLILRLAVCAGCDWEAARELDALGGVAPDTAGRLQRLCRGNLLQFREERGRQRYRMLGVVREYALERLAASADAEPARRWHTTYYAAALAAFAEAAEAGARRRARERLDGELENVLEALERAEADAEAGAYLRAADQLAAYLCDRGRLRDAAGWLRRALPRARHPAPRLGLRLRLGEAEAQRGDYDEAVRLCDAALDDVYAVYRLAGVLLYPAAADAFRTSGMARVVQGDLAGGVERLRLGLACSREAGDRVGEARTLHLLSRATLLAGGRDEAERLAGAALDIALAEGQELLRGQVLRTCAAHAVDRDDLAAARRYLDEAARLAGAHDDTATVAACTALRGMIALQEGDLTGAGGLLAAALRHCRASEDEYDSQLVLEQLAHLAALRGRPEDAARWYGAAAAVRERLRLPGLPVLPEDRALRERQQHELRAVVGVEAYEQLWREGRRMPLAQAVAEAVASAHGGR